ncbi:hypothetical protein Tco_1006138 [Tanacetum coccineum]|uniref:Uncharacterized protein n=1 Tax=Tanacetum coccineum TaxID=301880 RepID=A0ABQ5FH19_9ASTR
MVRQTKSKSFDATTTEENVILKHALNQEGTYTEWFKEKMQLKHKLLRKHLQARATVHGNLTAYDFKWFSLRNGIHMINILERETKHEVVSKSTTSPEQHAAMIWS